MSDTDTVSKDAEELLSAERAEKEIAERNRDAARENFLTMQKSAAKLLKRAEKAEAIIAAITKERDHWKEYSSGQGKLIESGVFVTNDEYVRLTALEADNAAMTARVKELERHISLSETDHIRELRRQRGLLWDEKNALEAKLAAAEKVLEEIAKPTDMTSWTRYQDVRRKEELARAVLGGK